MTDYMHIATSAVLASIAPTIHTRRACSFCTVHDLSQVILDDLSYSVQLRNRDKVLTFNVDEMLVSC